MFSFDPHRMAQKFIFSKGTEAMTIGVMDRLEVKRYKSKW